MPRAMPVTSSAAASTNSGPSSFSIWVLSQRSSRACTVSRDAPVSCSSARMRTRGRSTSSPAMSLPTGSPIQRIGAVGGEHELLVGRLREPRGARVDLAGERLLRRRPPAPWLPSRPPSASGANRKPSSRPIDMALDHDFAGLADFGFEHRVLAQPPHQHAGAAIDEALGQPLVQRVGQLVLDRARDALPVLGIGEPVRTVRRKGPGPDMRDAVRERVDVAVGAVGLRDLAGEPVGRESYPPASGNHRG